MIEEVSQDILRIIVPVPDSYLETVNCYVIKGKNNRNLVIDPGINLEDCRVAVEHALKALSLEPEKTDYFVTHHHADHFGIVSHLATNGSAIYIHRLEAGIVKAMKNNSFQKQLGNFLQITGFFESNPAAIFPQALTDYGDGPLSAFKLIDDGAVIDAGKFHFRCIATPGHASGHTCLYDPETRILLSGDHLLRDITPSFQPLSETDNPLNEYFNSLVKTAELDIDLVLPGHDAPFGNCKERIEEVRDYYMRRSEQVLSALAHEKKDAHEAACQLISDAAGPRAWNYLPLLYKFYETSDVFAHLTYLDQEGRVQKRTEGGRIIFSRP